MNSDADVSPGGGNYPPVSPWIGWIAFAGVAMCLLGAFHVFQGLVALVSAVTSLAFMSAYPVWSVIMIGLDIVIIWALTVHGSDIKP